MVSAGSEALEEDDGILNEKESHLVIKA